MAPIHDQPDRIIVAVDFGTTFSGVAFTYSGSGESADEISVLKNWPCGNNITSDKVPSELSYHRHEMQWGYQIKLEQTRLRCMKLLLDPRQDLPDYVTREDLSAQLCQYGKTVEEAVSDYLTALREQIKQALLSRYGPHMVSTTKTETVLTVPAVWSDTAKDATRRAAIRAGMGQNLSMISEPEAAATYALNSLENPILGVGDNFIVCDAGGGTVDLVSYEIGSLSPLRLSEAVPGTGGLCGGVFLNTRFEKLVKTRMGEAEFKSLRERKSRSWETALRYFEDYVKRNFDPTGSQGNSEDSEDYDDYDGSIFNVPLPGVGNMPTAGIEGGSMVLTTSEVEEIFRPIVESVIELVEEQKATLEGLGKNAKGVILVGGFGQSTYLYKSLKSHFADSASPTNNRMKSLSLKLVTKVKSKSASKSEKAAQFIVMQPANAWTAVVRGAVLDRAGNSELVVSRKARRSYGIACDDKFDKAKHEYIDRYWDPLLCHYRANHQTEWHIQRAQDLPSVQPVLLKFFHHFEGWEKKDRSSVTCSVLVSNEDVAPKTFRANTVGTRVLCELGVDLSNVPSKYFKERVNDHGIRYSVLHHDVSMTIASGTIHFDLRVDGVVYGAVSADYE